MLKVTPPPPPSPVTYVTCHGEFYVSCIHTQESEQTSPLVTESETVTIDKQPQTPSKKKKNKKKKEPAENQKTETAEMLQAKSGAETGQEMPAHTPGKA